MKCRECGERYLIPITDSAAASVSFQCTKCGSTRGLEGRTEEPPRRDTPDSA